MQTPHRRASTWHYFPYAGGKRLSPKSLAVPLTEPVETATAAMIARGDHVPAARSKPDATADKSLLSHLDDYEEYRRARNKGQRKPFSAYRVREVIKGCGSKTAADVTEERIIRFVAGLRGSRAEGGVNAVTANKYLKEVKWFLEWMVKNRRCQENPLDNMDMFPADGDLRNARRDFTPAEQDAILTAARESPRKLCRLKGPDRYMLYRVAGSTGLRAGAIATLTPADFNLTADPPTVSVVATHQKNRERIKLPLHPGLAAELREYLAGRPADRPVWRGSWWRRAADILKVDLAAAGVPEVTSEGNAHFHSFRHTFTTKVARATSNPKVGMSLTGHKTASIYLHYVHVDNAERVAVVNMIGGPAAPSAVAAPGPLDLTAVHAAFLAGRQAADAAAMVAASQPLDLSALLGSLSEACSQDGRSIIIGDVIREGGQLVLPDDDPMVYGRTFDVSPDDAGDTHVTRATGPGTTAGERPHVAANRGVMANDAGQQKSEAGFLDAEPKPQLAARKAFAADVAHKSGRTRCVSSPDLVRIVSVWPTLPEPIRLAVLALISTAAR